MAKIKLSQEQLQAIGTVAVSQEGGFAKRQESLDPDNLKVFQIPVGEDVMVYIPSRTQMLQDVEELYALRAASHQVSKGKSYDMLRCHTGIVLDEFGLDGKCDLCEAASKAHELYTHTLNSELELRGIVADSAEADALKSALSSEKSVQISNTRLAFPIVVIKTTPQTNSRGQTIRKIELGEDGKPVLSAEVFLIAEFSYNEKVIKNLPNDLPHPAGQIMMFKYKYDTKGKVASLRDSAKNFSASVRTDIPDDLAAYIKATGDELTARFTLDYMLNNLASFAFMDKETLASEANKYISSTLASLDAIERQKVLAASKTNVNPTSGTAPAVAATSSVASTPQGTSAAAVLEGFQLEDTDVLF